MLVTKDKEIDALGDTLLRACKKWKFDGFVLELWSQVVGRIQNELLVHLIQEIGVYWVP